MSNEQQLRVSSPQSKLFFCFFFPLVRQRVNPEYRDGNRGQLSFSYDRMEIFTKERTARRDLVPACWTGLICLKFYALKEI